MTIGLVLFLPHFIKAVDQVTSSQEIDAWFNHLEKSQVFSGAVLVMQKNDIFLHKGYGLADDEANIPVTAETVFDIGSISKQFTSAAIMHLEMQGLLSVSDSITKYFDNVPVDKRGITIHHLLTHSAGFTKDHFEGDLTPMNKQKALQSIFVQELGFEPGVEYHYSNTGYTLLAMIIENVSGQSYRYYLRKNFFEPLEMNSTGFYGDVHLESLSVAHTYLNGKDQGKPSKWPGPYWGIMGNGGIMSTINDMYTWWQALENHVVLKKIQTEKLFKRHISEDGDSYYGYGWSLADTELGCVITHNGGGIGGNSDFAAYPDSHLIIIILSNRIIYKMLPFGLPYEIHLPATESRQQLALNIDSGDFSIFPSPTFMLAPYLLLISIVLILILIIFLFKFRQRIISKK